MLKTDDPLHRSLYKVDINGAPGLYTHRLPLSYTPLGIGFRNEEIRFHFLCEAEPVWEWRRILVCHTGVDVLPEDGPWLFLGTTQDPHTKPLHVFLSVC